MSSFLSEHVTLLYNIKESNEENYSNCFDNILFNWENVGLALGVTSNNNFSYAERYKSAESAFWGIINYGGKLLMQESFSQEYNLLLKNTKWHCDLDIENLYEKFRNARENSNILLEVTLKLTAMLDRSLGNIVLLREKEVPFLMKDLLMTQALRDILGAAPILFMQFLMGNVKGLNIRNIAWHGFFSKNEIKPNLVATLFLLIPSIGNILIAKGYDLEKIPKRAVVNTSVLQAQAEMLLPINLDLQNYSTTFNSLVKNFPHISSGQQDFWLYAYDLYITGCYGDAIVIILPIMEHMLRSVYCKANECSDKKMTAETSEFYITLDVMLEKNFESVENNLINLLGEKLIAMLLDLFSYQHGLRLRDKISHFEMDINNISEEIANHTITLNLCIMQHLLSENAIYEKSYEIQKLFRIQNQYEPLFHPISLLKRQIHDVLNKINKWSDLPRPSEYKHFSSWSNPTKFELIEALMGNLRNSDEFIQELIENANGLKYLSLFRPPKEIELVYLFQRINTSIEEIHNSVTTNLNVRYNLWNTRQMRSRQRENYYRMLEFIFSVQAFLLCILNYQINIIKQFMEINESQLIFFIKYFKTYLKYVENVNSLSQANKNRWEEIKNMTDKCCSIFINMSKKFEENK